MQVSALRTRVSAALTRLLAIVGLARAADVHHERRRAKDIQAAERARSRREIATVATRLRELRDRLHAIEERLALEETACETLREEVVRYRRAEAESIRQAAILRRLQLTQIAVRSKAAQRSRTISPAAQRGIVRLASMSSEYSTAAARWRAGEVPANVHRVTTARLRWIVPSETCDAVSLQILRSGRLPLDDLAAVREFVVGGTMLDIGAAIGATSIPRVIMGDFARVYAAEPASDSYFCLVGNTLANGCEGRVLPHRVAIGGSAGPGKLRRAAGGVEEVPFLTVDAWMTRFRIVPEGVRFVRVALQDWNMDVDRGAAALLTRRLHVVWQIEISPEVMAECGSRIERACARLAAHFTHVTELGRGSWRPASDASGLITASSAEGCGANLLLFNVTRDLRLKKD